MLVVLAQLCIYMHTWKLTSLTCSLPNFLAALGSVLEIASSSAWASLRIVVGDGSRSKPLAGSCGFFAFGFAAPGAGRALLPPRPCGSREDCRIVSIFGRGMHHLLLRYMYIYFKPCYVVF